MGVQVSASITNFPFIRSGSLPYNIGGLTIAQDAGRTAVLAPFTVMGKIPVTVPTTGTADAGNTGDGTVTAVALAGGLTVPKAGAWLITCITAVTNGGIFSLTDPDGNVVRNDLTMTAGAGAATVFILPEVGLTFTITDGDADFAADDFFTVTIAANGKLTPWLPGAVKPVGIYLGDSITAAALVAGNITDVAILAGGCCTVDSQLIVFDDGVSTVDTVLAGGQTVREALAAIGIFVESTIDIDGLEN